MPKLWWLVAGLVASAGCAGGDDAVDSSAIAKNDKPKKCKSHKRKNKTHGDCTEVTTTVGLQGGVVSVPGGGPSLTIPFGALPENTPITISTTDEPLPSGVTGAVGPVFEFQPEGLVFAKPVTVTLPMPAGQTTGQVYWSQLDGPGFDAIGGTIANGQITTQTVHFSLAVIGSPLGTQTLLGSSKDMWISASHAPHQQGTALGTTPPSIECSAHELEAIVDNGAGGLTRVCGDFAANRESFTVTGVPLGGDYMLHVRDAAGAHTLLVASTGLPDLGTHLGGRPFPASTDPLLPARTAIVDYAGFDLHIDGLGGWYGPGERTPEDPGDQIEMFSTENDGWWFQAEQQAPPASGATSADLAMPWEWAYNGFAPALIEGSRGDHLIVAKLEGNTANGFPYQAMTRVGVADSFDLEEARTDVLASVALAQLAPGVPFSVSFDGAEHYTRLRADGNPLGDSTCAGLCGGFVGILAQGGDAQFGFYTGNADLMLLFDRAPTGSVMTTGAIPLGTFTALPGSWGELAVSRWSLFHQVQLPGTSGSTFSSGLRDSIEWVTTRDNMTGTVGVKLSQVKNVTVNGGSFFAGAASVGGTTTLAWDLPDVGTPLFYGIRVKRLFVGPYNNTRGEFHAQVYTPDRNFTFPPDILDPNGTYAFTVSAHASTGDAAAAAALVGSPFKTGLDVASSAVSSGVFGSAQGTPPLPMVTAVASGFHFPIGAAINANGIFWTERYDSFWDNPWVDSGLGEIWMANLDGTGAHAILTGLHAPSSLAVHGTTLYWIDSGVGPDSQLRSYTLGDPNPNLVVAENGLGAVAVSPAGDVVYCGGTGLHVIPWSGGSTRDVAGWCGPNITADATNAYVAVYGTGPGNSGIVVQVALDGSSERVLATNQAQTWDIETDGTTVYWTDQAWEQSFPASINRVTVGDTTGTSNATLFEGNEILKVFAIDGGYAYFINDGVLKRVALDGSSGGVAEDVAQLPSACPQGQMSAFGGHVAWTDVCSGEMYVYP